MLKAAEKHDFLMMRMVEVCKKSHFNSGFKANILDLGRFSRKNRKKAFGLLYPEKDFDIIVKSGGLAA